MSRLIATAKGIHASVDSCVLHITEAEQAIVAKRVDIGCGHLQDALRVSKFVLKYSIDSGFRNAPVVAQAIHRLISVINTLEEISTIHGWSDKCIRYQNKKRKRDSNYEGTSERLAEGVREMKRMMM